MASSLSRKLLQTMLTNPNSRSIIIKPWRLPFCSKVDLSETEPEPEPEPESTTTVFSSSAPSWEDNKGEAPKVFEQRPLENGLEVGIYKAILVGQVGQTPIQKRLKSGRTVTLLSIGTGGIRNNRRPFDNEEPREYANRCAVQWHRVSVYPDRLAEMAMKSIVPGSILYVEGNLETKIFTDPITGLVRRIREVAVRRNGRLVSIGNGSEAPQPSQAEVRGVGYY